MTLEKLTDVFVMHFQSHTFDSAHINKLAVTMWVILVKFSVINIAV